MNYDVDYFITKFSAIPDELWCTDEYTSPVNPESHCAMGHCGVHDELDDETEESKALCALLINHGISALCTNDGENRKYQQETPRARILAALHDIKSK